MSNGDASLSELIIRIRPSGSSQPDEYSVEASLDHGLFVRMHDVKLAPPELSDLESNPLNYGHRLGEILFADPSLRSTFDFARGSSTAGVRVRLQIDESATTPLGLIWELLVYGTGEGEVLLSASKQVFLSRAIPTVDRPAKQSGFGPFRLLLAIASPTSLEESSSMKPIRALDEISNLRYAWDPLVLRGQLHVSILARINAGDAEALQGAHYRVQNEAVTLDAISECLDQLDGIHLICHGKFNQSSGIAALLLESPEGGMGMVTDSDLLPRLDSSSLRLLYFQACQSATRAQGSPNVFSGLAPKAAARVPAVVAMQDFVAKDDATTFACEFYKILLSTGEADIAANAGRLVLFRPDRRNWAIPAVYLDPRVRIWEPDPLINAVQDLASRFQTCTEIASPFPIEVIRRGGCITAQTETGPPGPRIPVLDAVKSAICPCPGTDPASRTALLVGTRGRAKSSQLRWLFSTFAKEIANNGPLPLFLRLSDFESWESDADHAVARAFAKAVEKGIGINLDLSSIERSFDTPLVLLLDADEDTPGSCRQFGFSAVEAFLQAHQHASLVLTLDEQSLSETRFATERFGGADPAVFFVQLLTPATIAQYLQSLPTKDKEKGAKLYESISAANLFDIASVPWLLGRLKSEAEAPPRSRSAAICRISDADLAAVNWPPGAQRLVRDALGRAAWILQSYKSQRLDSGQFYEILGEVRGRRELSLEALRDAALQSEILRPTPEDGVRFAYPGFQSFWCAKHLLSSGRLLGRHLDDITATLGRRVRVRLWEDSLVLLSGLLDDPGILLRRILAGSGLSEGEQTGLAATCISEARLSNKTVPDDLCAQVVDNLIYRSHSQGQSRASVRKSAIQKLGLLREPTAIPHLVALASEQVRTTHDGKASFEFSGVRQAAVEALLSMRAETEKYLRDTPASSPAKNRADALLGLMAAWQGHDHASLQNLMLTADDGLASIAAFALGFLGGTENLRFLVDRITAPNISSDIIWAIGDALLQFNPVEVTDTAVARMKECSHLMSPCAYLIGKLGIAGEQSREAKFLRDCIAGEDVRTQGMALRALAQLGIENYRHLCELIASEQWVEAESTSNIHMPTEKQSQTTLIFYAIESLRLIGNESSIEELRKIRLGRCRRLPKDHQPDYLIELNFEVSEDIYWRITKGMEGDSYGPAPS